MRHVGRFSKMLVEEYGPTLDGTVQPCFDRIPSERHKDGPGVDELLNLARLGRQALDRQPNGLNALAAEVVVMLKSESEWRQAKRAIADLPPVECNPVSVKQVFQNLLANAVKFTCSRTSAVVEIGEEVSKEERVMIASYDLGANSYIQKATSTSSGRK